MLKNMFLSVTALILMFNLCGCAALLAGAAGGAAGQLFGLRVKSGKR